LRSLLAKKEWSAAEMREDARRSAESRCLRTWRGVSDLTQPGICSIKDSVYLRGYLSIVKALKEEGVPFERVMVGSIGVQHLDDLAALGITKPVVPHRRLATDPDLEQYISQFID